MTVKYKLVTFLLDKRPSGLMAERVADERPSIWFSMKTLHLSVLLWFSPLSLMILHAHALIWSDTIISRCPAVLFKCALSHWRWYELLRRCALTLPRVRKVFWKLPPKHTHTLRERSIPHSAFVEEHLVWQLCCQWCGGESKQYVSKGISEERTDDWLVHRKW